MIQIINWSSYQSYKDRKPPWIRLHKSLLDNYDFHKMSANARALLPMLWLLASEDKDPVSGLIRFGYEAIAFRLRLSVKDIKSGVDELLTPNEDGESFIKLIQPCIETVTEPLRNGRESVTTETETETETERAGVLARPISTPRPEKGNGKFTPPTIEEVREYAKKTNTMFVDPEWFHSNYSASGWKKMSGLKIVNWKAQFSKLEIEKRGERKR